MIRFLKSKTLKSASGQPPRTRHALWWTIEALAGFVGILLLALGILCARLAMGPLSTDSLTPYIAKLISDPARGLVASIAHGELVWDKDHRVLLAHLDGLVVNNAIGDMVASAPFLEARLDVAALLGGTIKLTDFALRGAQLRVERLKDGQLVLYGVPAPAPATNNALGLDAALAGIPARLQTLNTALTHLGTITIGATQLMLTDRLTGQEQVLSLPELKLALDAEGRLQGTADLALDLAGTKLQMAATVSLDPQTGAGQVGFSWKEIQLAALSGLDPSLAALVGVKLPLSGDLQVDYQNAKTSITRLNLQGEAGLLQLAAIGPTALPIKSIDLTASVAASVKDGVTAASLSPAKIVFGDANDPVASDNPQVTIEAALTPGLDAARGLTLAVDLKNLPTEKVGAVWPATLSPNPRIWVVDNIKGGGIDEATFKLTGTLDWPKISTLKVGSLGGTIDVSGATVTYYGELPPITNAAATATYDATGMKITVVSGIMNGIALQPSDVTINYAAAPETIDIVARGAGKLGQVLEAINRAPLHYADRIGLKPDDANGDAAFTLHLALPLLLDVTLDQVQVGLDGTLKNFASDKLLAGIPIANGDMKIALTTEAMTITGPLTLIGIPAGVSWKETFSPPAGGPASLADVKVVLDKDGMDKLGFGDSHYLSGSLPLGIRYQRFPRGFDTVDINGDLKTAGLNLAVVGYEKPVGAAGSLAAKLRLQSGAPIEIASLNATGPELIIKAKGIVAQKPLRLQQLTITQGTFGATSLAANISRLGEEGWRGTINAGLLDISSLNSGADDGKPLPPLDLSIDAKRALFGTTPDGKPREVAPLHAILKRDGKDWQTIDLSLKTITGEKQVPFSLQLQPMVSGGHHFTAETDNLGAVLRATDQSDFMLGGKFYARGESKAAGEAIPIEIKLDDYRVRGAPFVANLVSAISAEGLLNALSGQEGLGFGRLRGTLQWRGDNIQLENIKTSGGALGLTAEGNVNIAAGTVDLQGTAVPFNSVNSLLGNIPIIGQVLGGTSGVFAAAYKAKGPFEAMQVSVNPLSILAPGFLRELFFVGDAPQGEKQSEEPKP